MDAPFYSPPVSRPDELLAAPTLGRPVRSATVGDLSLLEVDYPAAGAFSRHAHQRAYVCLLLRGSFEERLGSSERAVASGAVVLMPAGVEHAERFGSAGGRSLVVTLPEAAGRPERTIAAPAVHRGGPVSRAALAICRAFRRSGELAALAIEEHLAALLATARAADEPEPDGRLADRARDALAAGAGASRRLAELAADLECAPATLARAFRRRFGCTMSVWLRRRRVEMATQRLAGSPDPLVEVALACGFADQSHLSRVFKAETGLTPLEYRRLATGH